MPPRSKVHALPSELKEWLDNELMARGFSNYEQLAADLNARGAQVSRSALQRYGSPFEKKLAQLKLAGEQARSLVDAVPDEEDKLGAAVIRMTQEKIFNLLALRLAREPRALAALRERLHRQRDSCLLFDTDRFCSHLESAYQTMHQNQQSGHMPRSFSLEVGA